MTNKEEKPYQKLLDSAWDEFGKNEFDKAEESADKIIEKYPDAIGAIALKSHISLEKNRYEDSLKGFETCLELDIEQKNHGYLNYWIGRVYDYYGFDKRNPIYDTNKAVEFYEKALKYKNYPPDLILKILRKKTVNAQKILIERGIKEFPDFTSFYVRLFSLSNLISNSSLLDILRDGYAKSKSYTIGFLIGRYFEENKNYPEAISAYTEFSELITTEAEKKYFFYSLATTHFKKGEFKKAIEYFVKISEIDFGNISIIALLQAVYICIVDEDKELATAIIEKIQIKDTFFQTDFDDNLVWLESEYPIELCHIIDFKILEKSLRDLKKDVRTELNENISLILLLILKRSGKHFDRYRIFRQFIGEYSQDYLLEEFADCYYDYAHSLIDKDKDISSLYKNVLDDLIDSTNIRQKLVNSSILDTIIDYLFSKKEYEKVIRIGKALSPEEISKVDFWFKLAYSYGETEDVLNAQRAYEYEIKQNPKSSASLNNLSLIHEKKGNYEEALHCISEAKKLEPDKELYERNFNRIKQSLNEKLQKDQEFKESIASLENETDFAISRLTYFIQNLKSETNFINNKLPIANWMFPKLIGLNKELANSLKEQWLSKRYIVKTNEKAENNVAVYLVNPFIEKSLEKITVCKVDDKWINGITAITKEVLDEIDYFNNILKINKVNKKYKDFILRDYKELTINFLLKNEKATLIIAGSLTEYLLTYYCEKKRIMTISYQSTKGKTINKKLYDCVLDDLINYFESNSLLKSEFYHLNNLSRIYRNYVHPGKELRDTDELNMNKAKICFIGVSELLKKII